MMHCHFSQLFLMYNMMLSRGNELLNYNSNAKTLYLSKNHVLHLQCISISSVGAIQLNGFVFVFCTVT